MAEFSAPFDGSSITTELQWSRMARRWGSDGAHTEDPSSTVLKVTGSGTTNVTVAPGGAFVNGFYYYLDTTKTLAVPTNSGGAARVDLVVLRADQAANSVTAVYKTGGTTVPPLTQVEDGVWEIPLAQCTVAAGSAVVTAANVVDKRYLTGRGVVPSVSGARPPSVKNTLLVEGTDLYVGDGASWQYIGGQSVKEGQYTPVWTAGGSNISWGSGSINFGRYQSRLKRVDLTIQLQPTGNPAASTDPIYVSLPPGLPAASAHRSLFTWAFTSGNGEGSAVGVAIVFPTISTSQIVALRYPVANGNTSTAIPNSYSLFTNTPFNIRSGDVLTIDGSYWLA
ncbi:hypothetical protein [Streptomyces griseofuscus]|uniref:hypothetical protein n=1 Tax=Streptomyces griseofuscus TaxID=146922 RepID=UPI0036848E99